LAAWSSFKTVFAPSPDYNYLALTGRTISLPWIAPTVIALPSSAGLYYAWLGRLE